MAEYVYIEYPKCLYKGEDTCTVQSAEEEAAAKKKGWKTAEEFYAKAADKKAEK